MMKCKHINALMEQLNIDLKNKEDIIEGLDTYNNYPDVLGLKFTASISVIRYIKNLIQYLNKFKEKSEKK